MPMPRGTRPIYQINPRMGYKNMRGRKRQDDISGVWDYAFNMTTNDDGQTVIAIGRRTLDRRYDLDFGQE